MKKRCDTMVKDKQILDELTVRFFNAFTNRGGTLPDADCLYELFVPEAKIVNMAGDMPTVYSVREFIEPRRAMLTDGTLTDFCEEEVSETTDIFRNIAQRFSHYKKSWSQGGEQRSGGGAKSIQFIRTPNGWKIFSLSWDDDVIT
jgi:hypothetical protein